MEDYSIEKLPDEPIIISRLAQSMNNPAEVESTQQTQELMDAQEEPFYFILDLSEVHFDINSMILSANRGTRQEGTGLRHPMIKEVLFVTQSKLINLAAKGLNSEIFGRVPTSAFGSVEEALDYARSQIEEGN